ncbi:MAG: 2TM domain-containing protein [Pseudomonadales bacterium]|nr:2TM domain-containing protein [Pseudomonadales bacterium]
MKNGWSQDHLAELTGLSVRTIQRLERGQKPSLESANALAAVFEVDLESITEEADEMQTDRVTIKPDEETVLRQVRDIKGFYAHLLAYVCCMPVIIVINMIFSPGHYWFILTGLGWGLGVLSHGVSVFEIFSIFSVNWEKKEIEKRLGRRL